MGRLDGRIAIITGAARGQGQVTAEMFAAEGARIVVADVLEDEARAVAALLGTQGLYQRLDVASEDDWTSVVAAAGQKWGAADILINNAGIVLADTITGTSLADWNRVLGINLTGAWLGIRAVAPGMIGKGRGSIVNICSMAGLIGMHGLAAYQASKWGLRGLTKATAMELGHRGIRANAVFPGGVNTIMGNVANETAEEVSRHFRHQPIQRIGEPEEVARVTLFLTSDEASYVQGAEITVDGGRTLGSYDPHLPGGIVVQE